VSALVAAPSPQPRSTTSRKLVARDSCARMFATLTRSDAAYSRPA
jgi:hypothetical protein